MAASTRSLFPIRPPETGLGSGLVPNSAAAGSLARRFADKSIVSQVRRKAGVKVERRDFPRLVAPFRVRCSVCGRNRREIPGFTRDLGLGGLRFRTPSPDVAVGDHVALEVTLPQFETPLYFLGEVMRIEAAEDAFEVACRFDWIGSSDGYREKLHRFLAAHGLSASARPA